MARTRELSVAFAENHPADAARVLEHLSHTDAAAFLKLLPVRLGAPVLRHMLPTTAAACLEQFDMDAAAGLMRDLDTQSGTAILRYVDPPLREQLIAQLPTTAALAFRLLLTYPEDTVGAWVNPRALAVTPETPVGEALERLRQSAESLSYLFVVSTEQRLLGMVALADLLRAGRNTGVAQTMRPVRHHLSARASLAAARDHLGWRELHALPVLERPERFIGVLDYPTLRRAGEQHRPETAKPLNAGGAALLAHSTWGVFAALLQTLVGLLPPASEKRRES